MSSPNFRPMCQVCKHRMSLARISPGERGFEELTFECSTCGRTEKMLCKLIPLRCGRLAGRRTPAAALTRALDRCMVALVGLGVVAS